MRAGTNHLLGLDPRRIDDLLPALALASRRLEPPPRWDGHPAERAAAIVARALESPRHEPCLDIRALTVARAPSRSELRHRVELRHDETTGHDTLSEWIASTAVVAPSARIGERVRIGHGTIVYDDVEIGDDVTIGEVCVIGEPSGAATSPLRIGAHSTIRSHAIIYQGAQLGTQLQTGHHVLIRENSHCGVNLRLGSHSSLEGELEVGDYVRIHGYVHVGQGSVIGDFVWLFSLVTCANDPLPPSNVFAPCKIGTGVVVALNAQLLGCTLGDAAFVSAGALVQGEIPPGQIVRPDGSLGGPVSRLIHLPSGTRHPWFRHLEGQYPPEAQVQLEELRRRFLAPA